MNNIMTHVVTEGTGRAAQIPGRVISGKTGTSNESRNVWFNGFTGNLVGSVWFGNDDNSPMGELTGGVLPAQSWHDIMEYALRNLESKPPFGVAAPAAVALKGAKDGGGGAPAPNRAASLAPPTGRALLEIADFVRAAQKHAEATPAAGVGGVANATDARHAPSP